MRVVVSGGGTAGHITPALSVASYLQDNDVEVFYAGTPQDPEGNLARNAGLSFKAFEASGFNRTKPLTIVKGIRLILKSTRAALCWFEEIKPDVVVGFGGYVSIPVARAAIRHKRHWWWKWSLALLILFFIGSFFQHYAEGMLILALSLLGRDLQAIFWMKDGKNEG